MADTFPTHQLDQYLKVALLACDGAKVILNNHYGHLRHIDEKFQAGLVSEADRESEKYIVDFIRSHFPDHAILGEESGLSGTQKTQLDATSGHASKDSCLWMIDPLDGTTNYVHQFPFFNISIGLEINGELVVGVVDAPKLGLRYHATKGGGAFMNGEPIHVSQRKQFREGLFATGFSSYDDEIEAQLQLCADTTRDGRGIRRAGAAALDLCFVAQGAFDVFWERNLQPWDTAAGVCIATEAGAITTDLAGAPFTVRSQSVVCGNPALQTEIVERYQNYRARIKR